MKRQKIKTSKRMTSRMYFVFDLDETLAEMQPMYSFIESFHVKPHSEVLQLIGAPYDFEKKREKAYHLFVHHLLQAEKESIQPLGLLRPGILRVMKQLKHLQEEGLIRGVVIYSNNSHKASLELIRDILHAHVRSTTLIKDCIHFLHPLRQQERRGHTRLIQKTWEGLKNAMIHGETQAPADLKESDVYFFDDLQHISLNNSLGSHYIQVPPYMKSASIQRIGEIYIKALRQSLVDESSFVLLALHVMDGPHVYRAIMDTEPTFEALVAAFQSQQSEQSDETEKEHPVEEKEDEGIQKMEHVIQSLSPPKMKMRRYNRHYGSQYYNRYRNYTKKVRHLTSKRKRDRKKQKETKGEETKGGETKGGETKGEETKEK